VHAGGVHPHGEWLALRDGALEEVDAGREELLVGCLHALPGHRARALDLAASVLLAV
jgi:hypothetical protein